MPPKTAPVPAPMAAPFPALPPMAPPIAPKAAPAAAPRNNPPCGAPTAGGGPPELADSRQQQTDRGQCYTWAVQQVALILRLLRSARIGWQIRLRRVGRRR